MIGPKATLADIVLCEIPDVVDLMCYEEMPTEDELNQVDQGSASQSREGQRHSEDQVFVIETLCGRCEQHIRVCIECQTVTTHALETLLLRDLQILCPDCYRQII